MIQTLCLCEIDPSSKLEVGPTSTHIQVPSLAWYPVSLEKLLTLEIDASPRETLEQGTSPFAIAARWILSFEADPPSSSPTRQTLDLSWSTRRILARPCSLHWFSLTIEVLTPSSRLPFVRLTLSWPDLLPSFVGSRKPLPLRFTMVIPPAWHPLALGTSMDISP